MNEDEIAPLDICLKSAARHVLKEATEDFKKENKFTPTTLLKLRCFFGPTFERALELYEAKKVTVFYIESTRINRDTTVSCFYEVKGHSTEIYTIFPHLNFCTCIAFENQVLSEENSFTCKHVLAVWLAATSSNHLNSQAIQESKFYEVLLGRVT